MPRTRKNTKQRREDECTYQIYGAKFLNITSAVFDGVAAWWNSALLPGLDAGAANGLQ
jgi:hypothetical protein